MSSRTIAIAGALLAATAFPAANPQPEASRIKAHVRFLSSDLLEGRGVGTRGGRLTAEYLAAQLGSMGVEPAGDNGTYFQTVPMLGVTTQPGSELQASANGKRISFVYRDEWVGVTHRQREAVQFDAEAVFVGHGIVAPNENWNDYKGVDVKGKVVVLFTNEPQPENPEVFKGRTLTYAGRWTYKLEEATRQGAAACLIIHTTPTAGYGWEVVRNSWSSENPEMKRDAAAHALALGGWLTTEAGNKLLQASGHTVEELLKAADSRDFRPIPLGVRIQGKIESKLNPMESQNVLGILPGGARRDEYVMYSAHWDHLGMNPKVQDDGIYNGAIDNATGCGVVLEIARAMSSLDRPLERSVLFAFWTAEEAGLRGAEYYAAHPLFALAKTAANINYDALFPSARTKTMVLTGADRTTLWPQVQAVAKRIGVTITPEAHPEQGSFYRSDHFMLAKRGVPAFKVGLGSEIEGQDAGAAERLFEEYNTKRYHRPSDEFVEDWDFSSLQQAAMFGYELGLELAKLMTLPGWNKGDEFAVADR
jgi:Zn-dependent M28 family amino/carboxypeptidase